MHDYRVDLDVHLGQLTEVERGTLKLGLCCQIKKTTIPYRDNHTKGVIAMRRLLLVVLLALLCFAPTAQAHYGNIWFQKATTLEKSVVDKYPRVVAARCKPLPLFARARYSAHSMVEGSVRYWDHFLCGVYSNWNNDACLAVAHITGERWNQFVLTTWPLEHGCTPYQLRG
jgi:hypothetical protein